MFPTDDNTGSASSAEPQVDKTLDGLGDGADGNVDSGSKVDGATSSDAQPGDNDAGELSSIVRDVVAATRKQPAAPASPAEGSTEGQAADDSKKDDDEGYTDVPFHKHPRFQHLLRRSKQFEADAVRYRNVEGFLASNGVSADEAADALTVAGLLKTNPVEAWKRLRPIVQNLLVAAGELLPDDLSGRVNAGEITQEAALEIARSRAALESVNRGQAFRDQQAERAQQTALSKSLMDTASSWESERRRRDPTFDAKAKLLRAEVLDLQRTEGVPNTPEGVRQQLNKAYQACVLPFAPAPAPAAPQAKRPVPNGSAPGNTVPNSDDTRSIIRAARERMRA